MVINYKEIASSKDKSGFSDTFELFSRDFLELLGFTIIEQPDRGADGKKDMIVEEIREGIGGKSIVKWLVSCKHYAHSSKSVNDIDEPDLVDRVTKHKCDGFIGVYSTIQSTSLSAKIKGCSEKFASIIYDKESIEKALLKSIDGIELARRYFPISISDYKKEHSTPADLYSETPHLNCDHCGAELLTNGPGIFSVLQKALTGTSSGFIEIDAYYACKGKCDRTLERHYHSQGLYSIQWVEIDDLKILTLFIKSLMGFINDMRENRIETKAINKLKEVFLNVFPHTARELSESEKSIVSRRMILSYI